MSEIFIAAPREMSARRLKQLFRHYLPKGNVTLGISREPYVLGFEGQPQFAMLQRQVAEPIVRQIERAGLPRSVKLLEHSQADTAEVFGQLSEGQRVLLVNGSWQYAFHNLPAAAVLAERGITHKFISPFADEQEARTYEASHTPAPDVPPRGDILSEHNMLAAAERAATQSFDYSFQTGASLGKKVLGGYEYLASAFNKVIPWQARILHEGSVRERHRSRPHDTNHYDTIHAEMLLLTEALARHDDLAGATLFVTLLPCPNCARTLSQTAIAEIIYTRDHSDGYAAELLASCGKTVRQIVL